MSNLQQAESEPQNRKLTEGSLQSELLKFVSPRITHFYYAGSGKSIAFASHAIETLD